MKEQQANKGFVEKIDDVSTSIKDLSKEFNIPEDLVIKIISENMGLEKGEVAKYINENKKVGKAPNWLKLCTSFFKYKLGENQE
ncbi:hypothetical protein [Hydrogenovibrio marinus]|uniref:Uncharacterized protein n=1 Tax=Hydrogenovibrio marinus TaxID=28885 RepID=A0A066ZQV5_HYDMR|nr:hypothetical protein [Hydrogenovibrio marinus]KDN94644.1 hypothetical protein EI16_12145 [Hydrogenovibrio marinus]